MSYYASDIAKLIDCRDVKMSNPATLISHICTDTRISEDYSQAIFFSLPGKLNDGHDYINQAIQLGIKNVVVAKNILPIADINIFYVDDVLFALQSLVATHRDRLKYIPCIAITGSNGKTTVKEWLYDLLFDRNPVKSPKSYNSQTGVALSVWQLSERHNIGIFEAGVSTVGEMVNLERIIQPNIGIFTMLGDAHDAGFVSKKEKLNEKLILYKNADFLIFEDDGSWVADTIKKSFSKEKLLSWGESKSATCFQVLNNHATKNHSSIEIATGSAKYTINIPFSDPAFTKNAMHCVACLIHLGYEIEEINRRLQRLHHVEMRLEMIEGVNNTMIINDTYSADFDSLKVALNFLKQHAGGRKKAVILSEMYQTGLSPEIMLSKIADVLTRDVFEKIVFVGNNANEIKSYFTVDHQIETYKDVQAALKGLNITDFADMFILVKGARAIQMEHLVDPFRNKMHSAYLEIDLRAIDHNVRYFSSLIKQSTKIIAVIKASAYGSGSIELARFLEYRRIDYIAVAYVDEGVKLRQAGIKMPIMILNPDSSGLKDMLDYELEPEVYSLDWLAEILMFLKEGNINIHLKLDTGMSRLGFSNSEIPDLLKVLDLNKEKIMVKSVFSHLASSEDPGDDDYTHNQIEIFDNMYSSIQKALINKPLRHILNTAGIQRFPQYQFDMVRLGLGLYGIDSTTDSSSLEKAHQLWARVIQIKKVKAGDFVGYNRRGKIEKDGCIAVINIGYADGLMRNCGNDRYKIRIGDKDYPIIGNVCMDLTIIDIGDDSHIQVGDKVLVFGKNKPIETLADTCQTIPYEILCRISPRVRRIYVEG